MIQTAQLARLGLFDARVPRYTSYPTAPHFSDKVGPGEVQNWVREIAPGTRLSLYLHIPFCRRLCWFCACRTQGTANIAPVLAYVEVLKSELKMLAEALPEGVELAEIHWGGGTPTLLPAEAIRDLAAAVRDVAPLADQARFAVEIDPNEIDESRLDALAEAGMSRASVGVQDFAPEIQTAIGRAQEFETTKWAIDGLRDRGVHSLNIDLLYGLPKQTATSVADSLQQVLSLAPDRLALFGYAHVPWMARRQIMIQSETLPGPEARLSLFETARQILLWDGFVEIGIDHFARPEDSLALAARTGHLRRNFQGYTDDTCDVQLGVGASAISRFPQGYAQNKSVTKDYVAAIRAGDFAIGRGHSFTEEDLVRARIIESLMCTGAATVKSSRLRETVSERFGAMVEVTGDIVRIADGAHPLTRMIAQHFDAYALAPTGHSHAV